MSNTKDGKLFDLPVITMDDVANLLAEYRLRNPRIRGFDIDIEGNVAFEISIGDCGGTRLQAYFKVKDSWSEIMDGSRTAHAYFDSLEQAWNAIQDDCVDWLWPDEL